MPRITPTPVIIAGVVIVGDCVTVRRAADRLHALSPGRSQHLHRAVRPHLDVRGLQIAMDDPLLVRRFERLGDLLRDRQRLVERDRAARDPLRRDRRPRPVPSRARVTPPLSFEAVDAARCSDDSARRGSALRAGTARADRGRPRTASGRTLIATSRFELRVARAIDLAHAAGAEAASGSRTGRGGRRESVPSGCAGLYGRPPVGQRRVGNRRDDRFICPGLPIHIQNIGGKHWAKLAAHQASVCPTGQEPPASRRAAVLFDTPQSPAAGRTVSPAGASDESRVTSSESGRIATRSDGDEGHRIRGRIVPARHCTAL